MLIAKGYGVVLKRDKKTFRPPGAILHDPSGTDWPKCSVLIGSFTRGKRSEVSSKPAVEYFNYVPRGGAFRLPARDLKAWKSLGEITYIEYTRPGDKEFEGESNLRYDHNFAKVGSGFLTSGKHYPKLYRLGRLYRLELGAGCVINWRGFVSP